MNCGLCGHNKILEFAHDKKRDWYYYRCQTCDLVFRDPSTFLNPSDEKKRYDEHNNGIENPGYVEFLSPVVKELLPYLNAGDRGLDYGCGPGPILQILFAQEGYPVDNYDPYFFPKQEDKQYDFLTCTEVVEHVYEPRKIFNIFNEKLKTNGLLLVMTSLRPKDEEFLRWYYIQDNTHVSFYSKDCFDWLSAEFGLELIFSRGTITLWRKKFSVVSKISI